MHEKYWLRIPGLEWKEVSQDKFVEVERNAGFHPKPGCGPVATAGFGTGTIDGRVTHEEEIPFYSLEFFGMKYPFKDCARPTLLKVGGCLDCSVRGFCRAEEKKEA